MLEMMTILILGLTLAFTFGVFLFGLKLIEIDDRKRGRRQHVPSAYRFWIDLTVLLPQAVFLRFILVPALNAYSAAERSFVRA